MRHFWNALLLIGSLALSLAVVEAGYRLYLKHDLEALVERQRTQAERGLDDATVDARFSVYAPPAPWQYNEHYGYDYQQGQWRFVLLQGPNALACGQVTGGNEFGNVGVEQHDYWESEIRILFFGSSYTQVTDRDGRTAADLLESGLEERFGLSFSVLNFSRDATGLLTSFDMARLLIPQLSPDLVIFAFNGSALGYRRHWRTMVPVTDNIERLVFMLEPLGADGGLPPPERYVPMPQMVSQLVTTELCAHLPLLPDHPTQAEMEQLTAQRLPPEEQVVVERLFSARRQILAEPQTPVIAVDFGRLDRSFVFHRIVNGDPYYAISILNPNTIYSSLDIQDYAADPAMMEAVEAVLESGIPFVLLHIPTLAEMRNSDAGEILHGTHGIDQATSEGLVASMERITGQQMHHLYQWYDDDEKRDPLNLVNSEQDSHPSPRGTLVLYRAILRAISVLPETQEWFNALENRLEVADDPEEGL